MLHARATRFILVFAALVGLVACGVKNPNFCEGAGCDASDADIDATAASCTTSGPDPACPADSPVCADDLCGGACTADTDCAPRADGAVVCLQPPGDCVACDEDDVQAAPGSDEDECPTAAMAVCDGDSHTCRACEVHAECASGVCDAGTCVAATDVIYMKADGTDGAECGATPAAGCLTMQTAIGKLTTARKYIVLAPSATEYISEASGDRADFNNKVAHVIGYGATLRRRPQSGTIVDIRGTSDVVVEGLTIAEASGLGSGIGITNTGATLELRRATVRDSRSYGVSSSGPLRVVQSLITNNAGGGIIVGADASFVITNNFIVGNGGGMSSTTGGVQIGAATTGNLFEFNTIVFNNSTAPDVACTAGAHVARNNIIFGFASRPRINVLNNTCAHSHTLFGPDGDVPGASNMKVDEASSFQFRSVTDFHVAVGTVATGKAIATSLSADTSVDYDGDPRAQGSSTLEVGADEIP